MVRTQNNRRTISVELSLKSRVITVKGKYGEVTREFNHMKIEAFVDEASRTLVLGKWMATSKQKAVVRTLASHVTNMMNGVSKKFQYKMRLVYNHFPISIATLNSGRVVEIRNFLGEKRIRLVNLLPGVTCEKSANVKDEIILSGIDIEYVSRSAALIHQSTLVRNKDIRLFLDGIYVSEKGVVDVEGN